MSEESSLCESSAPSFLKLARERLITKDDPLHLHKTLGILALCSFAFRLAHIGPSDMGFQTYPQWTIPTILLHLCLTLSSFHFNLPKQRISYGGRLWPQARLHSAIFVCRSLVVMVLYWIEDHFQLVPNYTANFFVVLLSMCLADLATWSVGKYKSNTIRDLSAPPSFKYFYSLMQFYATTRILFGMRRYSVPFVSVVLIQTGAFSATLRRKNLLRHKSNVVGYVGALAFVNIVTTYDHLAFGNVHGAILLLGNFAAMLRMGPSLVSNDYLRHVIHNKYFIWTFIHLLLSKVIRPILESSGDQTNFAKVRWLRYISLLSLIPVLAHGYVKTCSSSTTDDAKKTK